MTNLSLLSLLFLVGLGIRSLKRKAIMEEETSGQVECPPGDDAKHIRVVGTADAEASEPSTETMAGASQKEEQVEKEKKGEEDEDDGKEETRGITATVPPLVEIKGSSYVIRPFKETRKPRKVKRGRVGMKEVALKLEYDTPNLWLLKDLASAKDKQTQPNAGGSTSTSASKKN